MQKSEKTIVLQLDKYYNPTKDWSQVNWEPVAILPHPADIHKLIADWEKKFRAEHKWGNHLDEFSIGEEKFKIVHAKEWTF